MRVSTFLDLPFFADCGTKPDAVTHGDDVSPFNGQGFQNPPHAATIFLAFVLSGDHRNQAVDPNHPARLARRQVNRQRSTRVIAGGLTGGSPGVLLNDRPMPRQISLGANSLAGRCIGPGDVILSLMKRCRVKSLARVRF